MIIYDLEIQNLIPPRDGNRLPDFKYCDGWHDHFGMGFACAVLFDTARNEFRLFDEFMLNDFKAVIARTDVVAGFNIINFDNKVLAPYEIVVPETKCYDLLAEIARAAGTPNDYKGLSLNAVCEANFNTKKIGDGANAPMMYQQKRFGELFDYCLADVRLTKKLLDRVMECGNVINPRTGKWVPSKQTQMMEFEYYWRVKTRLPERFGQPCRVLARGKRNSCLLEFEDGYRVITSRNYFRKLSSAKTR